MRALSLAGALAALWARPAPALAAGDGGTVTGTVELGEDLKRAEPPVRSQGFVKRIRNPILPARPFDPRPYVVVFLDEGPVDAADKTPPGEVATFELLGDSFSPPLVATVVKGEIQIHNSGRNSPILYSPQQAELLTREPLNPTGKRTVKLVDPFQAVEIRDLHSTHLSGYLVAFPHRYFARVDGNGKFSIEGVPAGTWTVRVWYRDGWLPLKGLSVAVESRRSVTRNITLPASLAIERGAGQ